MDAVAGMEVLGASVVENIGNTPLLRLRDPAIPPRVEDEYD